MEEYRKQDARADWQRLSALGWSVLVCVTGQYVLCKSPCTPLSHCCTITQWSNRGEDREHSSPSVKSQKRDMGVTILAQSFIFFLKMFSSGTSTRVCALLTLYSYVSHNHVFMILGPSSTQCTQPRMPCAVSPSHCAQSPWPLHRGGAV